MSHNLINEIISSPLWITPSYAQAQIPQLMALLNGKLLISAEEALKNQEEAAPQMATIGNASTGSRSFNIASMDLRGPVTKYGQWCGPAGTKQMSQWFRNLDSDAKTDAIVLQLDSGGGTAIGTLELIETIRSIEKPVVAWVDNIAASAAYYIAAATDEIITSSKMDMVGSIGTMAAFADFRGVLEKQGGKWHEIYATKSTDKNGTFRAALEGRVSKTLDFLPVNLRVLSYV
ncbi:S49 family peptidase [Limibacter armeniacum]|uniref:S49 family peptidase n=1 Tax=Limibacter armeniacum TaxID=466084 RepID=UPI002FE5E223